MNHRASQNLRIRLQVRRFCDARRPIVAVVASHGSAFPASRRVLIGVSHAHDDPESVLVAYLVGIEALRTARRALMWLTKEAVILGIDSRAGTIDLPGAASIAELHDEYVSRGGEFYASAECVALRGLDPGPWIRNAQVRTAQDLYLYIAGGADIFNY